MTNRTQSPAPAHREAVDHAHEILRRLGYHRDGDFLIHVNRRGAEALHVSTIAAIVDAALIVASPAPAPAVPLVVELQQWCSDRGLYWRAPDAHGVVLSVDQATELLALALGVEVEIKTTAPVAGEHQKPAFWVLKDQLEARETICNGRMWFSDPQSDAWAPVYTAPQAPQQADFCDAHCTWLDHAPGCERAELTDEQIDALWQSTMTPLSGHRQFARSVIAADRALRAPGMGDHSADASKMVGLLQQAHAALQVAHTSIGVERLAVIESHRDAAGTLDDDGADAVEQYDAEMEQIAQAFGAIDSHLQVTGVQS